MRWVRPPLEPNMFASYRRLKYKYALFKLKEDRDNPEISSLLVMDRYLRLFNDRHLVSVDHDALRVMQVYSKLPDAYHILLLLQQTVQSLKDNGNVRYNARLISDIPAFSTASDWYWIPIREKGMDTVKYIQLLLQSITELIDIIDKEESEIRKRYIHRNISPLVDNFMSVADLLEAIY